MSDIIGLKELLSDVSVDWKPLGEVGDFQRGKRFVKTDIVPFGTPCIHYDEMYTHYGVWADRSKSFVAPALASKLRVASNGDVIIVAAGETIEEIGNATAWLGDDDVVIHDACFSFRSPLNAKYVSYFFRTEKFKEQIKSAISSGKISSINSKGLSKATIPIPCPEDTQKSLAIQGEIVRILDAFTALTAELTAELTARKTQYNHYRNQLLSFEGVDVEWKTLGEVCDFKNGFAFKSALFREDGLPIIRITNVAGGRIDMDDVKYFDPADYKEKTEAYRVETGDILVAMSGATTGKIGVYEHDFPAYLNQRVGKFIPDASCLHDRFLYHFLLSKNQQIYTLAGGGAQPNLSSNALKEKMLVPLPFADDTSRSLEEQRRIGGILDKLDMLATSLSEGLPREIGLRTAQYDYYRNLLLGFPKGDKA